MHRLTCDCSYEYGPCEQHGDTLVIREGASLHTADELALLLIEDLVSLGAELSAYGHDVVRRANAVEDRWLEADLAQELSDLAFQVEQYVADLWVIHNDGYVVVRPHDDCPLGAKGN